MGKGRLRVSFLAVGSNTIVAEYAGDSIFGPASSLPLIQTVTNSSSATVLTLTPNPSVFGQTVTVTASVVAGSGFGIPTGTVTFSDGSTNIGTAALDTSGNPTPHPNSLNPGIHHITPCHPAPLH